MLAIGTSGGPVLHCGQCSLQFLVYYPHMTSLGHDRGKHVPSPPPSLLIQGILPFPVPGFWSDLQDPHSNVPCECGLPRMGPLEGTEGK